MTMQLPATTSSATRSAGHCCLASAAPPHRPHPRSLRALTPPSVFAPAAARPEAVARAASPAARGEATSSAAASRTVEDVMTKGVYTVGPNATVDEGR